MAIFKMIDDDLFFDGKKTKIISGAIHYFRTVPEYWEDRLRKLKACGFNTVETYIPWNMHEPIEGEFCFDGMADVERYIRIAEKIGLFVIVRPGPYICAEWEAGGLPFWLLKYPGMSLRCYDEVYLSKVDAFYDILIPKLLPMLCTKGGPIIAVQVENEYGSYGSDKKYLEYIKNGLINRGVDVLLFTSDGTDHLMLQGGTLDDVLKTVNFGSRPEEAFEILRKEQDGPVICMEYWMGWFDHWREKHHTRETDEVVDVFRRMLYDDGHVNFYMFHGGTNFAFYNGSNYMNDLICPTTTSYDYNALLNEAGDMTNTYYAVKACLEDYMTSMDETYCELKVDDSIEVSDTVKAEFGQIQMVEAVSLFEQKNQISKKINHVTPLTMEECDQAYGFIMYVTQIDGKKGRVTLTMDACHDRALVYLDGKYVGKYDRSSDQNEEIKLVIENDCSELIILVENLGRINYGDRLMDHKGLIGNVRLDYQYQYDWDMYPLPLNNLDNTKGWKEIELKDCSLVDAYGSPMILRGMMHCDKVADTYLNMDNWTKGVVYVNGHNLGRYWSVGPQRCLYVPAPYLKEGNNEIIVVELEGYNTLTVRSQKNPEFTT